MVAVVAVVAVVARYFESQSLCDTLRQGTACSCPGCPRPCRRQTAHKAPPAPFLRRPAALHPSCRTAQEHHRKHVWRLPRQSTALLSPCLESVKQVRQHPTSAAKHTQAVRPARSEVERLALAAACLPSAVPITVAAGKLVEGRAWYDGRLGGQNLLQTFRGRPACCVVKDALGCERV